MSTRMRILATLLLGLVVLAGCGSDAAPDAESESEEGAASGGGELVAQVASYDLAATGEPERFTAGLLTAENEGVVGGTVDMEFAYLGREEASGEPEAGPSAEAAFLPVPGKAPDEVGEQPQVLPPAEGVGVYETEVAFDRPGLWEVTVTTEVGGEERTATASFNVWEEHLVPTVGDEAPRTDNLTLDDVGGVPAAAVDSRAGSGGEVPDPVLHRTTIAEALEAGRPLVVVFSTPVYCLSQFCGPITDTVEELADRYGDRAAFVHVEVWRDYDATELNDAYDRWANAGEDVGVEGAGEGREPWTFAVGSGGRIAERWDNVLNAEALESWLQQLPAE
jgi:hypothetical protein